MLEDRRRHVEDTNTILEEIFGMMHPAAYQELKEKNSLPEEAGFASIEYHGESEEALDLFQSLGMMFPDS